MDYTLRATTVVPADRDEVFDVITDLEHLPDWNLEIPRVVAVPAAVTVGAEWVVAIHAMGTRWNSRSRVLEVDRSRGRFAYRSQSDDGNPSYADWRWELAPAVTGGGTQVTVEVDVRPRTYLRRWVLSTLRRPSLRRAITTSLATLVEHEIDKERS
jgi:uncharacterized protein YndB with AHSA1/START domain